MAEYTYRFADLLSDADLCELELSNVRFDRRIIVPGAFSASIVVTNADIARQVKRIVPSKTVVHVYRDADIWGTYIIWTMRVRSSSRAGVNVEITGASLESWFHKRLVDHDQTYVNMDQFDIVRDLLSVAQVGWGDFPQNANLGIISNPAIESGTDRTAFFFHRDVMTLGQVFEKMAGYDEDGFEYLVNTYVDTENDLRVREFVLRNKLGNEDLDIVFTYPGSILEYEVNMDATESATAFWARGDSAEVDVTLDARPQLTVPPQIAEEWHSVGFPHMDRVIDLPTETEMPALILYATWWKVNRPGFVSVPVVTVNPVDVATMVNPSNLGSYATFTIYDEYYGMISTGPEFSSKNRIVGIEVTPGERGSSEKIRLVIEEILDPVSIVDKQDPDYVGIPT